MSFWKKILGGKPRDKEPSAPPAPGPTDIKVYDEFGRELYIARDEWRTNVLSGALADARNDPDKLYSTIVHALQDGFASDLLEPAQHLKNTDTNPVRGACLLGIV